MSDRHFSAASAALGDSSDFTIQPGDTDSNAVVITTIIHEGDCDVKYQRDTTGDGTFDLDITIDSLTGTGISQSNELRVAENDREQLVITNTSGGAADFAVSGIKVRQ